MEKSILSLELEKYVYYIKILKCVGLVMITHVY